MNDARACECCGAAFAPKDTGHAPGLDGFCVECRDVRCDAFPGECPAVLTRGQGR